MLVCGGTMTPLRTELLTGSRRLESHLREKGVRSRGGQREVSDLKQTDSLIYRRSDETLRSHIHAFGISFSFHTHSAALFPSSLSFHRLSFFFSRLQAFGKWGQKGLKQVSGSHDFVAVVKAPL